MAYHEFLLATPYSYSAVAGLIVGLGVGGLIPGPHFSYRNARRRAARFTRLYFCLSFALAVSTAGLLICGLTSFAEIRLVYTAGTAVALGAMAARFPRSAGGGLLGAALAVAVAVWALTAAWHPPAAGAPEARFRVLRAGGGTLVVDYVPTVGSDDFQGRIFTLSGTKFAVEANILRVSEYLFFVGAEELYRLNAIHAAGSPGTSGEAEAGSGNQTQPFPRPELIAANWVLDRVRRYGDAVPGLQLYSVTSAFVEPRPLEQYVAEIGYPVIQLLWDKRLREASKRDDTISKHDDHPVPGR